jgi:hypothetical protein
MQLVSLKIYAVCTHYAILALLTLIEAVNAVINRADDKLLQALLGENRGDLDLSTWLRCTHAIFIALHNQPAVGIF